MRERPLQRPKAPMFKRRILVAILAGVLTQAASAAARETIDPLKVEQFYEMAEKQVREEAPPPDAGIWTEEDEIMWQVIKLREREALSGFQQTKRRLNGSMKVEGSYESNFFQSEGQKKPVMATQWTPDLTLNLQGKKSNLSVHWDSDILMYNRFIRNDRMDNRIKVGAGHTFGKKLKADTTFRWSRLGSIPTTSLNVYTLRTELNLDGEVKYLFGEKFSVGLKPMFYSKHFSDHSNRSSNKLEWALTPVAYYQVSPKTQLSAEFQYLHEHGGKEEGSSRHLFNSDNYKWGAGISGSLFTRATIQFTGGVMRRIFFDNAPNLNDIYFEGLYNHKLHRRIELELRANRDSEDTTNGGQSYYVSTSYSGTLKVRLKPKWVLSAGLSLARARYDTPTNRDSDIFLRRRDLLITPRVGLSYQVKRWLSADLNYKFDERQSNFGSDQYENSRLSFGMRGGF